MRLYDTRAKAPVATYTDGAPLLAVVGAGVGGRAGDGSGLWVGGVEGSLRLWDARTGRCALALPRAHNGEAITGLCRSPGGEAVASLGMDGALRAWDARPFCASPSRLRRAYAGAANSFEQAPLKPAWSACGTRLAAGSAADRMVYIWDADSGRVEYRLPGHTGAVNAVDFHPTQPIILSAGSDKAVFLGEIARVHGVHGV